MRHTLEEAAVEAARQESKKQGCWNYKSSAIRQRFVSPWDQYADRIGQRFVVLESYPPGHPEGCDEQFMFLIRFEDGTEITAWAEEVCVACDEGA